MSDEQLLVTLGVQDKGANKQITSLNKELKYLQSEFKSANQGSEEFENSTEGLRNKLSFLEKSYEANRLKLEAYNKKQEETKQLLAKKQEELVRLTNAEGDNSQAIQKVQNQMERYNGSLRDTEHYITLTENEMSNLSREIENTNQSLNTTHLSKYQAGMKKLEEGMSETSNKLKKFGEDTSELGEKITTGITLPIIAAGLALGKLAYDTESDLATLSGRLGTTGKDTENLKEVAQTLYSNGFGDSLGSCVDDLVLLQQNIKSTSTLTNEQKESLLEQIAAIKTLFGAESEEITKTISKMMNNGVVSSVQEGLDVITRGFQSGANASGDMLDTLDEYSVQFDKLGLNGSEALNYISKGLDSGGYNADKMADSLKELSIRAIDGSSTTVQGFQLMGLNADDMAQKFAKGGDTAKGALKETLTAIKNIQDPVIQNTAAVDLFGGTWEDSGKAAILAMADVEGGLSNVEGATKKAGEEMNSTMQSQFTTSLREVKEELLPLGVEVLSLAKDLLPALTDGIKSVTSIFSGMTDGQKKAVVEMLAFGACIGPVVFGLGKIATLGGNVVGIGSKLVKALGGMSTATSTLGVASATSTAEVAGASAGLGTLASGALALAPTILLAAGAIEVLKTQQDLNNMSILESTDNMGPLEKALNTLGGGYHKTNEELVEMGIKYSDFSSNVSEDFKLAVETSADKVRDFNKALKDTSLDGVITQEESDALSKRVAEACQDAITTIDSYSDPGKQALVNAFGLDGNIDINEQAIIDSYTKKGDVAKEEVTKLGTEINELEKAQQESYSADREEQIKKNYQRIEEIQLTSQAKSQSELNALNTNWLEQIDTVSAEKASEFLKARAGERDSNNADMVEKNKAAIQILDQLIDTTTGSEREAYKKQKSTLEQSNSDKLAENRRAFTQYYEELKTNNAIIAENINMVSGEIMSAEDTKLQNRLINMENSMVGMNDITKTGYYQMYNTVTGTMDTVGVVVDEKTGLITGAFNKSSGESGQAMDGMMIKAQELANTSSLTSATIGSNYAQLSSTTVNSSNQIISKNGEIIGSLQNITTNADGTRQGIINLNGVPIDVKINENGIISTLDGVLSRMRTISGSAVTVSMRQTWTSDGRGGVYVPEGYASGTTNATRGVHLVGEEGPELIYFSGGETVLNTVDTSKVLTNGSYFNPDSVESGNLMNTVNNYNSTNYSNTSNNAGIDGAALASQMASAIVQALSKSPLIASVDIDRLGRAVTPTVERTITSKQIGRRLSK